MIVEVRDIDFQFKDMKGNYSGEYMRGKVRKQHGDDYVIESLWNGKVYIVSCDKCVVIEG